MIYFGILLFFITFIFLFILIGIFKDYLIKFNKSFICEHDFPINVAFELVEYNWINRLIQKLPNAKSEIKIGNNHFDTNVYISSDTNLIAKVLKNDEIKDLILDLITDPNISGIYINNKTISLKIKKIDRRNTKKINALESGLDYKVFFLKEKLLYLFINAMKETKHDNVFFVNDIQKKINFIKNINASFFITSISFLFYYQLLDLDNYMYVNFFPIKIISIISISIFVPIFLFILNYTKNTTRRHLLASSVSFFLIPAIISFSWLTIYLGNIAFDSNPTKITEENITTKTVGSGKGRYYTLTFNNSKNPILSDKPYYKISYYRYSNLPRNGKIYVISSKGAFDYPYISFNTNSNDNYDKL